MADKQVQYIIAGSGESPVPFPEEWDEETAQEWADRCQTKYRPGTPTAFQVTLRALRLWLRQKYDQDAAESVLWLIRGFPE